MCIKSIKMEMDKHPDWCFAELDGANAFNSQDRNAMFKGAQELMPFMLPWMRTAYQRATPLVYIADGKAHTHYDGAQLLSKRGPRQGCPLGSVLYCCGLHPVLRKLKEKYSEFMILAFIDNVYIGAPSDKIQEIVQMAIDLHKEMGITINYNSSGVYSPQGDVTPLTTLGFEHREHGMIVLKTPQAYRSDDDEDDSEAKDWVQEELDRILKKHIERLDRIKKLKSADPTVNVPQAQYILLRWCCVNRPIYWLRNCCPRDTKYFARDHDKNIWGDFRYIMGMRDRGIQRDMKNLAGQRPSEQAQFPTSMAGGLGLTKMAKLKQAAYVGSWAMAANFVAIACPDLKDDIENLATGDTDTALQLRTAVAPLVSLPGINTDSVDISSFHERATPNLQRSLTKIVMENEAKKYGEAVKSNGNKMGIAAFNSLNTKKDEDVSSGSWLDVIPMNQRARKMTGAQWATMVLYRLMLPICPDLEGKTCQCGQKMDAFGHHAHACKLNKLRHQQHNTVQYEFQKCFNDLEMNATLAWAGMYPNTPGKKWDLVVQNCPLYPALSVGIDFSITTPCCTSYVNAAQNPGGAAKARANVKNNKYLPAPDGFKFMPGCMETFGRWGKDLTTLWKQLMKNCKKEDKLPRPSGCPWNAQTFEALWLQRISTQLQLQNSLVIENYVHRARMRTYQLQNADGD